jgi:hypothetical protein
MGLRNRLGQASGYLRKLRGSLGPDGYSHYKRGRDYDREQADRAREQAKDSTARAHEKAERELGYEERYARESEDTVGREPTEPAEEVEPDR